MSRNKDFQKKLETVTEIIRKDWSNYRVRAGKAHAERGRGAFFIDVSESNITIPEKLPYRNGDDIKEAMSQPLPLLLRVGDYNPEREIVFAVLDFSCLQGDTLVLRDEEQYLQMPPIVETLPDTSQAQTLDELVDMIHDIVLRRDESSLSQREQYIWNVFTLKWEVDNGGFVQFFGNEGERWPAVEKALHAIGARSVARLFQKVCSYFPQGKPSIDTEAFESELDSLFDEHDDLWSKEDSKFYKISSEIEKAAWRYWKQH